MHMYRYFTVDLTGILWIVARGKVWIGNASHFFRFNFKPDALEKNSISKSLGFGSLGVAHCLL